MERTQSRSCPRLRTCSVATASLIWGCVLLARPANAAIQFVQTIGTATDCSGTSTNSLVINVGSAVAAGDTIIVGFGVGGATSGAASCTDSSGTNPYTVNADVSAGVPIDSRTVICSAPVNTALSTTDTITVFFPAQTSPKAASALEFSGLLQNLSTVATDGSGTGSGSSTSPSATLSASTTNANDLLFGAIGWANTGALTFAAGGVQDSGSGYTGVGEASCVPGRQIDPEYQVVSATGAFTADGTLSAATQWAAGIVAYEEVPLTPTPTPTETPTQTPTPTETPTSTPTPTPTATPTPTTAPVMSSGMIAALVGTLALIGLFGLLRLRRGL
jgi:hypothetical protein